MCVLRERGRNDEAERLRTGELAELVAVLRTPSDTDHSLQERLDAVFAVESERVADAAVIAELLAPLLSEKLSAPATTATVARAAPPPKPAAPEPVKPAPRATAASIADFIDEMIAQEGGPDRSGRPARRAS